MERKFSLTFFRRYFHIPEGQKICWCILVEKSEEGKENQRLGVMLCGSNKVIDIAARQFVQVGLPMPVSYSAYPAQRHVDGDDFTFTHYPEGQSVMLPSTYVDDLYFRCVYSEEMMNQPLI